MTAQQIIDRIRESLGTAWSESTVDTIGAGRPDIVVTGIVTCFAPSFKVLRQAAGAKRNMIVAREHVFYNHGRAAARELPAQLQEDPACIAKQDFLTGHNLVVWRFCENWDRLPERRQLRALARALGWDERRIGEEFFALAPDSLENTAAGIARRLQIRGLRVIGDPQIKVAKAALAPGLVTVAQVRKLLREPDVDAVVIGEPVEWEAAPYFQDVIASGQKKGMIVLGHAVSEEPGCGEMAAWLKTAIPGMPVEWMPAGEPFR